MRRMTRPDRPIRACRQQAFGQFGYLTVPLHRSRDLLILQAGRRLTEVPPPLVARAAELGRDAGKTAATWVFDGNTPGEAYQRVRRGIDEGDPAVLDAIEPPAIGPGPGTTRTTSPATSAWSPATAPCPGPCPLTHAFTDAFWQETERTALDHTC